MFLAALGLALGLALKCSAAPNVLIVLTDDQRWDTVQYMPNLSALAANGVTFANALQPTPLCAPSRSMLYSGGYHSHDTGVLGNTEPNGGIGHFHDANNLGAMLQAAGYETFFTGKWVNGYETSTSYVPPGWTHWYGRKTTAVVQDWNKFKYIIGSSTTSSNNLGKVFQPNQYTTYYERDRVLAQINASAANPAKPFFILWASSAPHPKAQPAPEDATAFSDFTYRGRGVTETDFSDKPSYVRNANPNLTAAGAGDEFVRNQLRSLQAVDRSVKAVIDQLKANGQYDNTLIIYTSDNGYMWDEHKEWFKSKPYQEDLRVPFIVWMPGIAPRVDQSIIAPSLDIGPTLFELAGINKQTHGMSIVPLLNNPSAPWRTELFLEEQDNIPAGAQSIWAGVITANYQYDRYWTGEEELYDVLTDPYQLQSLHNDPALASVKSSMVSSTNSQLGLAIVPPNTGSNLKQGRVGKAYSYQMLVWGGQSPLHWTLVSGSLPPGLTLDEAFGIVSGVPTTAGTYTFVMRLTDSAISPQSGLPHTFVSRSLKLVVQ
jgi:arylsulfatase A-like enzyme